MEKNIQTKLDRIRNKYKGTEPEIRLVLAGISSQTAYKMLNTSYLSNPKGLTESMIDQAYELTLDELLEIYMKRQATLY